MFGIGTTELVLILAIILIIFGVGKLPEIGNGMGKAIRNFKRASAELEADQREDMRKLEAVSDKAQKKEA